ncbi:MAG: DUF4143 domain-containing protein, partial [Coriobacteriales bacterium]|nr:DUF4143 domain-containing protein [Coriobacteriales bacterium]
MSEDYMGALFENYVIAEIIKTYQYAALEPPVYYYRDTKQKEIDLIIWDRGALHPIEVKSTSNPGLNAIKSFTALDAPTLKRGNGAVICLAPTLGSLSKDVYT